MSPNIVSPRLARDAGSDTMFGDIIRAHTDASGRLDSLRVLQETTSNLIGGSETTIILMAWALHFVVRHPAVEEALVAEIRRVIGEEEPDTRHFKDMPYLDAIVTETLRMRPPAYMTGRVVAQDIDLDGYRLTGGAFALVCQYITHHEPRLWRAAHRFRPERFLKDTEERPTRGEESAYFPFGGGQYFCIGAQYAINEAKLMLAVLLRAYRFTPSDPLSFADVGIDASLTLRPDRPILVRVEPRAQGEG
jgi:cytochrome P450